ncbi:hypothetical protein ABPG72_014319 [Tetrahymena utriculariae]
MVVYQPCTFHAINQIFVINKPFPLNKGNIVLRRVFCTANGFSLYTQMNLRTINRSKMNEISQKALQKKIQFGETCFGLVQSQNSTLSILYFGLSEQNQLMQFSLIYNFIRLSLFLARQVLCWPEVTLLSRSKS